MFSKRMIGMALLAMAAEAGRKDRQENPYGDKEVSAAYAFYPQTVDAAGVSGRIEEVFIGIYSVEGIDQDDIIVWGQGLSPLEEYNILLGQEVCDAAVSTCYWLYNNTYLSLKDETSDGMDTVSKGSKVTGDFNLIEEVAQCNKINTQVGHTTIFLEPQVEMTPLYPPCDATCVWGPVDDLKHMQKCLKDYGQVKRNGRTVDEQWCLNRRPTRKFCDNSIDCDASFACEVDCTVTGTCDDCTITGTCDDDCAVTGSCEDDDDDDTDDCNADGTCDDCAATGSCDDDSNDDCPTGTTCPDDDDDTDD